MLLQSHLVVSAKWGSIVSKEQDFLENLAQKRHDALEKAFAEGKPLEAMQHADAHGVIDTDQVTEVKRHFNRLPHSLRNKE